MRHELGVMSPEDRSAFLVALIGRRYEKRARGPDTFDCWGLVTFASLALFARPMPDADIDPENLRAVAKAFGKPAGRIGWQSLAVPSNFFHAPDGAVVMMARGDLPHHVGLWLAPERRVLHCCAAQNTVLDTIPHLRAAFWRITEVLVPRETRPTP